MEPRKRKRGIKASRSKLEAAMLVKGFETQTALAQQIAKDEGLAKPPKDLVNKVFREMAVSTHNIARIARVLDVQAHTIYLAKDDSQFDLIHEAQQAIISHEQILNDNIEPNNSLLQNGNLVEQSKTGLNRYSMSISVLVMAVITFLLVQHFDANPNTTNTDLVTNKSSVTNTKIDLPLGKLSLVIQSDTNTQHLARALALSFENEQSINTVIPIRPEAYNMTDSEALEQWQAHAVLRFQKRKYEYFSALLVNVTSKQHKAFILQLVLRDNELPLLESELTTILTEQIKRFVEGEKLVPVLSQADQALHYYVQGMEALYTSHSAKNFAKAKQFFIQAHILDTDFSNAYAQLCRINLRESWIQDETTSLEEAARYCSLAESLAPQELEVITARAELMSRIGESEKAVAHAQAVINLQTPNADALAVMAELFLVFNNTQKASDENSQIPQKIISFAEKAIDLEPKHWRAYNTLGNYYFTQGNIQLAKNQFEEASKVVKHEVILSNLGTMQMCFDELEAAKQTYTDLIENVDNNYIGHENLGSVYLMQHEFEQAVSHKLIAFQKQPDIAIHQAWAGLAEAHLRNGQKEAAFENYLKALTLTERDQLLNNTTVSDELHKLYYAVKLNELSPEKMPLNDFQSSVISFVDNKNSLGLKARSHLAWLAGKTGDLSTKQQLLDEVSSTCPVYKRSPELLFAT